MKKVTMCLLASFCLLSTACGSFSTPQALIKPPAVNKVMASDVDLKSIVQSYLPQGAKLLSTNEIVTGKSIYAMDLDGDKQDEILAFFKIEDKFEKGFIVLKKKNNKWDKIEEKKMECNSIARVEFTNVVSKDKKSLIVGSLISSHAGAEYKAYTFENSKVEETLLGIWNKFEILNTPSDKESSFVFDGWINCTGNVQKAEIFKLKDKKVYYGEDFNSYYKNFTEYYSNLIKEKSNNELAWYLLVDAQLRSGMIKEAYKSKETASQIDSSKKYFPVDSNDFKLLQVEALRNEKHYDGALGVLDGVYKNIQSAINNSKKSEDIKIEHDGLKDGKDHYLANVYIEYGKIYLDKNDKEKAREYFNKALDIFEGLNKKGYYGTDGYIDIHRDADINTVKVYLEKAK